MDNIALVTAIAGLVFGVAGTVMGLLNTWRSFDRDSLRLTISPRWAYFPNGERRLCFEVINKGFTALTVKQIGMRLRGHRREFLFFPCTLLDGCTLPQRMDPRTAITLVMAPCAHDDPRIAQVRDTFAETACGRFFYGSSPVFKRHVKNLRRIAVSG